MQDYNKVKMINTQERTLLDYIYDETAQRFMFVLFLASAFVFGLMYGYGEIESPKVFWLIAVMLIYYVFNPQLKSSPMDLSFLLLCSVCYVIAVWQKMDNPYVTDIYDPTQYAWIMPLVYLLGNLVVGNFKDKLEDKVLWILVVLGIGMYIQGLLNYSVYYIDDVPSRIPWYPYNGAWRSFWNPDVDGTRNNWNNGFFILAGGLFYAAIRRQKKRLFSTLIVVATLASVILNLAFRGRTMVVFVVLAFVVLSTLCFSKDNEGCYKKLRKLILLGIVITVILGIMLFAAISSDFFGAVAIHTREVLERDGGIFNNVRLNMWRDGLTYMFTIEKGGWSLDENIYGVVTPHNLWLEFARHYDIIVFFGWIAFLMSVLIKHFTIYYKYEKEYPIVYFPLGAAMIMFLFTMVEPIYILNQDLTLYFLFVMGVVSGIGRVASSGDYQIIGKCADDNRQRYLFVGYGLLIFALLANAYQDWWTNRLQIVSILLPMLGYVLGGISDKEKYKELMLFGASGISAVLALYCFVVSSKSEYYKFGFCIEPFTGNVVEKSVLYAFGILSVAFLIGVTCYTLKVNKFIMALITFVGTGVLIIPLLRDGRLSMMKEALRLQLGMRDGSQWIASKDNVMGLITSHCMWLDFARDYGMLTLGLLMAFEVWSIYCFIRILLKKERNLVDCVLIPAFILFNYHFMFEATAITSRYILAMGLLVYGMICVSVGGSKHGIVK